MNPNDNNHRLSILHDKDTNRDQYRLQALSDMQATNLTLQSLDASARNRLLLSQQLMQSPAPTTPRSTLHDRLVRERLTSIDSHLSALSQTQLLQQHQGLGNLLAPSLDPGLLRNLGDLSKSALSKPNAGLSPHAARKRKFSFDAFQNPQFSLLSQLNDRKRKKQLLETNRVSNPTGRKESSSKFPLPGLPGSTRQSTFGYPPLTRYRRAWEIYTQRCMIFNFLSDEDKRKMVKDIFAKSVERNRLPSQIHSQPDQL